MLADFICFQIQEPVGLGGGFTAQIKVADIDIGIDSRGEGFVKGD